MLKMHQKTLYFCSAHNRKPNYSVLPNYKPINISYIHQIQFSQLSNMKVSKEGSLSPVAM